MNASPPTFPSLVRSRILVILQPYVRNLSGKDLFANIGTLDPLDSGMPEPPLS